MVVVTAKLYHRVCVNVAVKMYIILMHVNVYIYNSLICIYLYIMAIHPFRITDVMEFLF